MMVIYGALVVAHMLCWALVLGANIATLRSGKVYRGTLHGALGAFVTGVAVAAMALTHVVARHPDPAKLGVKLVISALVVVLAYLGERKPERKLALPVVVATTINVIVAVMWH